MSFSPTARGCRHTWNRYRFLCGKQHQEEASFCVAVCGRWKELPSPHRPPVSQEASRQAFLCVAKGAFDALRTETQVPGESITDYVAELHHLATQCKFEAHLDEALRERLVCGTQSENTQNSYWRLTYGLLRPLSLSSVARLQTGMPRS